MNLLITLLAIGILYSGAATAQQQNDSIAGYYDPIYKAKLSSLSSNDLRMEYVKKLSAWGMTCIPDGLKVGVSGILETFPIASAFNNFFGGIVHESKERPDGGYDAITKASTARVVTESTLGAPISYAVLKVYDKTYSYLFGNPNGPSAKHDMAFYFMTRTFYHDSFDPKYESLCTQAAVAISQIRLEKARRQQGSSTP
jgi:hypothetical protein